MGLAGMPTSLMPADAAASWTVQGMTITQPLWDGVKNQNVRVEATTMTGWRDWVPLQHLLDRHNKDFSGRNLFAVLYANFACITI